MADSRPPPGIPDAGAVGDAAARLGTPQGAGGAEGPTNALSSERYLAWLYTPPERQRVFGALCQIEGEIAGSLRPGIDHHVAHARLQWWGEECERTAQGRPVHPLTRELVAAAAAGMPVASSRGETQASPLAGIAGFVDTAVWDLAGATFETRKELTAYCERWAAAMFGTSGPTLMLGAAQDDDNRAASASGIAGPAGEGGGTPNRGRVLSAAGGGRDSDLTHDHGSLHHGSHGALRLRSLGAAVRELELLAGLAREAHAGRLRVPLDELERAGIDPGSLAKTPWPAPLAALLRGRHEALRATIAEGVSLFERHEQPPLRGLIVWAALAWRLSWRAQRALPNAIAPRRYHALSAGWHAWRAAHRATAGKLRLH